jgi:hypothetical protein
MIMQNIFTERVIITVSPAGRIKASGNEVSLNRWLPKIRENKAKII